ncbi:winged helix-turn-helix transcriptional regulator [Teredinibacter turnerae]|uniref:winged helix-turn-helix transcriptional regulator n=1 Tax=Teredinibacter turnerae TaxID=2426 RepID=UPI000415CA03|nr:helix-turn-helix domain-containing protein [Teredinibacter turnerae]
MKRTDFSSELCSLAQTLNIVGEWWTWLIIRDIQLGVSNFGAIQTHLKISKKVLTDRLATLLEAEIIKAKKPGKPRSGYELTAKGLELTPIMRLMIQWGDKWIYDNQGPVTFVHNSCGHEARGTLVCDICGEPMSSTDCTAHPNAELAQQWREYGLKVPER